MAERGMAGSEIIDRKPDAKIAQPLEGGFRHVGALHDRAFGDFQLERALGDVGSAKQRANLFGKSRIGDLPPRHVHADEKRRFHGEAFLPLPQILHRAFQREAA